MAHAAVAEVSDDGVRAAATYSAAHRGTWLLVLERGKTRLNVRQNRGEKAGKIFSGTKAFWSIAALAAQEDGLLDLDERASATLPEWGSDPQKSAVTLRQLLNFTSGLEPSFSLHNDRWADRDAHARARMIVAAPGSSFIYGPAGLQVFHAVLARKLAARGKETPTHFLERRVLRPLGLGRQRYLADRAGQPLLATGFTMTAVQWARLGQLVLAGGAPVLKRGPGQALRGSNANPMFGLGFWNNRLAGSFGEVEPEAMLARKWHQQSWTNSCLCRAAPPDLIASVGSGGQRLYVVPSKQLVVVRLGHVTDFSDGAFLRALFSQP